jgi:hypothetical protein
MPTGKKPAKIAGKLLKSTGTKKPVKTVAASALSQAPDTKKVKKNSKQTNT